MNQKVLYSLFVNLMIVPVIILVYVLCFSLPASSQNTENQSLRLMFYNVENLFDIYDDPLTNDNDFLPTGVLRWNYSRYMRKINSLYKTIVSAGDWDPPALVALCEVENRKTLEDLVYDTYLEKYKYGIVHEDSPDQRGIDVCLLFREDCVKVINYDYWQPDDTSILSFSSRSVLYVKLILGGDTVHLLVNHWPSRRGGVMAAENLRNSIARMVSAKVDSLFRIEGEGARIIIAGDFNASPTDPVMQLLVNPAYNGNALINLSERNRGIGPGTYRFNGIWEIIDQIIVSESLLMSQNGIFCDESGQSILSTDFLLTSDPKYPGMMPYSTYRGYKYQGGFSDHLPVILELRFR